VARRKQSGKKPAKSGNKKKSRKGVAKPRVAKKAKKKDDNSARSGRGGSSSSGKKTKTNKGEVVDPNLPIEYFDPKLEARADEVRSRIKTLNKKRVKITVELMELLHEALTKSYYLHYGYDSFREYVKKDVDTVDVTKAYALGKIWQKFHVEGCLPKKEVAAIPWTKGNAVADEVTKDTAKEWQKKIEKHTGEELKAEVEARKQERQILADDDEDPEEVKWDLFKVFLTHRQKSIVDAALETAGKGKSDSTKENHILAQICSEWLALNQKGASNEQRLAMILSRLSDAHRFEIFAFKKNVRGRERDEVLNEILDQVEELFGVEVEIKNGEEE